MNGRPPNAQPDPDLPADDVQVAEAAAQWRARLDHGFEPGDEERFAAWLEADPCHAEVFREMDATWSILDRTRELAVQTREERAPAANRTLARPRAGWLPVSLAAAAVIALVAGFGWLSPGPRDLALHQSLATAPGMVQRLNLPDGSVVRLNSDSAVVARFSPRERRLTLERGEASFTVAKDSSRPFIVTTAGVDVRAVGTIFNVSVRSATVEVLVTEGRVTVNDATKGATLIAARAEEPGTPTADTLSAGEKVTIALPRAETPAPAVPVSLAAEDIARALAWQERRIEFNATPLEEIAREFNRFNQHPLIVADPELARLSFGGSFRVDDPDTFVRLIETRPDVVVERHPGQTVIRAAR